MRAAAEKAVKAMNDWFVGIDYREDVYKSIKAFAETNPQLTGEDKKLLDETMRDYRRAGLALPAGKRKEVEQLRKQLAKLGTDFDTNIANAKRPVVFTKAGARGNAGGFLSKPGIKTGDDAYTVLANVTWQFNRSGRKRQERSDAEETLHRARDTGEGEECATAKSDADLAQQDRAPARLQIVGRLSKPSRGWRKPARLPEVYR